ncbi:putative transcription factor C2H2 family [Helianthus annuus]|uniref:Transcription factor C2H2 family n=1 Tax=Helianthus annuus TaxID=4232 RepID=A0A9K3JY12_HELAN|nr:putative transcription factor C2H2 family [Helianthus annuus]KAJ0948660.1 putative transcription factor C2H2 family [Helianthus annuus]KAJ0957538.1 putative transcription factor C2H2 family [Helianthus annuus]
MEHGQGSASKSSNLFKPDEQGVICVNGEGLDIVSLEDDFKSLLIVPLNSEHSNVEVQSDEVEIHSDVEVSSFADQGWCNITRNSDLSSATSENTRLKIKPMNESSKKVFKISLDSEHAKCSLCLDIWHDIVTVSPCLHNFCNGCFSEWSSTSQEEHAIVLCPHCSSDVQSVGRNCLLHRIEKKIRKYDSFVRRSDEELVVNSYALIKSLPVIKYVKKPRSKRSRVMREEDNNVNVLDLACTKCGTEYGGFQCNENTVHLHCYACGGMMPSRTDIVVPQYCIGCDGPFCGAYWHSQQVKKSDSYWMCAPEAFNPTGERTITRIPYLAHEWNWHEQHITERCIQQMGKTLQDVVSEWVTKLNDGEIDRTRMPLNHSDMITSGTHLCNDCYDKLVSFLLYWFRISLPKDHLPEDAAQREDCWYGYACRTQNHNDDHARKRNHVCHPTKGVIGN